MRTALEHGSQLLKVLPAVRRCERGFHPRRRQAVVRIAVEIDQPVPHAVGLVKPDRGLVIHADVPERVNGPVVIEGHRLADPLVLARGSSRA